MITGSDKAAGAGRRPVRARWSLPAARIDAERTIWFADQAAAGELAAGEPELARMPWLLLLGAVLAAPAAYLVGWPAWTSYRSARRATLNAERYLAWRGRANEPRTARYERGA